MNHETMAGELWDIFTKECLLNDTKPSSGAWDAWLKKAKEHVPARNALSLAVQIALIDSPLRAIHGRASPD